MSNPELISLEKAKVLKAEWTLKNPRTGGKIVLFVSEEGVEPDGRARFALNMMDGVQDNLDDIIFALTQLRTMLKPKELS